MKKALKIILWIAGILLLIHLVMHITGHTYLYKGVWNTYLKGRTSVAIDEYKIFENREVETGNPDPWPLSNRYNEFEIPAKHLEKFNEFQTVAYLVVHRDSVLFEKYWEDYGPDSYSNSFSMAKTITSILTGIAVGEGKMKSLDQPVGDFLPQFRDGLAEKVKIRHLLNMSSGIEFDESYQGAFAYPARAYYGKDLKELHENYEVVREPGEVFDYQSGTTQVLGFVLTEATDTTLSGYASEKLWKPIGARNPAYWSLDRKGGMEKAFCCFQSNARDFARLGQLYLDSGRWKGKQVVPEDYVLKSIEVADLIEKDGEPTTRYGYSWWLLDYKGYNVFYERGILGQYVFVMPEKELVIVRLGHRRADNPKANPPKDVFTWLETALEMIDKKYD